MAGQPRRVFEYARNLQTANDWVSISAFGLGTSILIFVINFVWSTVFARVREEANPWGGRGLEWQIASPPPPGNFAQVPVVLSGPYEYGSQGSQGMADPGFASVFTGFWPVYVFVVFAVMVWLETLIMRGRPIPDISFVEQPPTYAEAFAVQRYQAALSSFTIVWNYLAVVAIIAWVLFYLVH